MEVDLPQSMSQGVAADRPGNTQVVIPSDMSPLALLLTTLNFKLKNAWPRCFVHYCIFYLQSLHLYLNSINTSIVHRAIFFFSSIGAIEVTCPSGQHDSASIYIQGPVKLNSVHGTDASKTIYFELYTMRIENQSL